MKNKIYHNLYDYKYSYLPNYQDIPTTKTMNFSYTRTSTHRVSMSPIQLPKEHSGANSQHHSKPYDVPWHRQLCWGTVYCDGDKKCKRMHPNRKICHCTDELCRNLHDTISGWSSPIDDNIKEKIRQKEKKIHQRKDKKKLNELLNTAFTVPSGIGSVEVVIDGEKTQISPEVIGPLISFLEAHGYDDLLKK